MGLFNRRTKTEQGGTATAPPPVDLPSDANELRDEIVRLGERFERDQDLETARRLAALRHRLGIVTLRRATDTPAYAEPDTAALPADTGELPWFTPDELTPGLLRAAMLRDGCALVRGLIPREEALRFATEIDRTFAERGRNDAGEPHAAEYYSPLPTEEPFAVEDSVRAWVGVGGGVLALDSPKLAAMMFALLERAGLPALATGYLGEPPLLSVHKTTLRKATPDIPGGWHQDGKFMGDVRALNLWLSFSRCGDEAPGLDIVPRRLDDFVQAQTDGEVLDYTVSERVVAEVAGDRPVVRPIFEPGDAVLFDDMMLHKTGSDPAMVKPRYALESWHFGPTGFPGDYAPVAV